MRAYVVSIGSELLLGQLTDTNATFLAQELVALGFELVHVIQVGDDRERITNTLRRALDEAQVVICTGGVGPTDDDLTREAIADLFGQEPALDETAVALIEAFFAGRGLTMPERNKKQAWLIPAAESLPNPVGTAPGWFVREDGNVIVAMPGVPREMYRMWSNQVVPRLRAMLPNRAIRSTTIKTIGIGESALEQLLDELVKRPEPVVATYAKDDGVHVRITATGTSDSEAIAKLGATEQAVRQLTADYIFGDDQTTLAGALLTAAEASGVTLRIEEIGTGGRFAALILGEPTAAAVIAEAVARPARRSGAVAPDNDLGESAVPLVGPSVLNVRLTADVTPSEQGLFEGRVVVEIAGEGGQLAHAIFPLRAAFAEIQRRAALSAADVLRRALRDLQPPQPTGAG